MNCRGKLPNLSHLLIFEQVAAAGSASQAADIVSRSQPAVAIALNKLETFAGSALLERDRSGSRPTEAGKILLARIRRLFDQLNDALLKPRVGAPFARPETLPSMRSKLSATNISGLIAIAQNGALPDAALATGVSKPSLYRIARDLEHSVGRPCFEHSRLGLKVNEAGAELARRLNLALREIYDALDEIEALRGEVTASIQIGVRRTAAIGPLSEAIREFLTLHPKAHVRVIDEPFDQLLTDLRHGRLDLLYGPLRRPGWATDIIDEPFFYTPYTIVARTDHPLAGKGEVTAVQLLDYDWIMSKPGSPRRKACEALFQDYRKFPVSSVETSSAELKFALLSSSDRIALLTSKELLPQIETGRLTILNVPQIHKRANDGITMRSDWHPTVAQHKFVELLRKYAARLEPQITTMHRYSA